MATSEDAKSDFSKDESSEEPMVAGNKEHASLLKSSTENEEFESHHDKERKYEPVHGISDSDESDFDFEFSCEVCNKTFSGIKPLIQHEKSAKHHKALLKKKLKEEPPGQEGEDENETTLSDYLTTKPFTVCEVCKKQFSGPESFQLHSKSRAHRKKVVKANLLEEVMEDGRVNMEKLKGILKREKGEDPSKTNTLGFSEALEGDDSEGDCSKQNSQQFECLECDKVFSGVETWYQHVSGKTHGKTMARKKLLGKLMGSSDASVTESSGETIKIVDDTLICQLCHMSFSGPENASEHLKSKGHQKKAELRAWMLNHPRSRKSETKLSNIPSEGKQPEGSIDLESSAERRKSDPQPTGNVAATNVSDASAPPNLESPEKESGISEDEMKNTLLRYEKYKEYKKIMAQVNAEEQ